MKMSKRTLIILIGIFVLVIGVGLWLVNGFVGNPVSKMIAKKSAENYIAETYREQDFIIDDVFYEFKDGYYHVEIKSETSIDTHFSVLIDFNKVADDTFADDVLSGWNTYRRIDNEYNQMVEGVFSSKTFPLVSDIDFGTIELYEKNETDAYDVPNYGVQLDELELDKIYDVKELAKTAGHIVYYAQDDEVSFGKASELLLILKESLDNANIPFYAVDFNLEKPREDDETFHPDEPTIYTVNFLYSDIYEEGLPERLEQAHNTLMEYYEEQDAKRK